MLNEGDGDEWGLGVCEFSPQSGYNYLYSLMLAQPGYGYYYE